MEREPIRVFGFEFGLSRRRGNSEVFDELSRRADIEGVQWRDLVQDGYRVAGDLFVGGLRVRFDWDWRIRELERRIAERVDPT